jgi:hypothetical protein
LGGRPQQILAVVLTYCAITTSYIPVYFHQLSKNPQMLEQARQKAAKNPDAAPQRPPRMGIAGAILILLLIFAAAPFFGATSVGGLISLFIIFIGLKQAWRLTGRSEILVMGPYETAPAQ